jgi:hypothetical protein
MKNLAKKLRKLLQMNELERSREDAGEGWHRTCL